MNIEISDEQIERILEKQISSRVSNWFAQSENKCVIRDYTKQAVLDKLRTEDYEEIVRKQATKLVSKDIMKEVCARISEDIAEAFAEKYADKYDY